MKRDVLGQDFNGVLGAHETGLQQGETGSHPHDKCAAYQEIEGINRVLQFKNLVFHFYSSSSYTVPASRMLAQGRCGWTQGWTEAHSQSYGLREAQVQAQLNKPEPG